MLQISLITRSNELIRACLVLMIMLLGACKKQSSSFEEHQVFRYNEHSNIGSLDPAFAKKQADIWAVNQLYNGLVQLDDSLQVQADIAKKWQISDDGKTYTFFLRDDVYFHKHPLFGPDSTRRATAYDFKYSFDRLVDPKVASPGGWVLKNVAEVVAANDSILNINLKEAFPPFLGLLTMKYCSVVAKEIVTHYGNDFRSNPIGTGPFRFKLWVENTKLVFRKNQQYYERDQNNRPLPYLEAVAISFLPDKQSEFLQFAQGKIDFISGLDNSYKDEILTTTGKLQERYKDQVKLITSPYLNTEYLGFFLGGESQEIQSKLIRQAVNYGFDRDKMVTYLRNGMGIPATAGFIPKGLPGFQPIPGYDYQPAKARSLVEQYIAETGDDRPEIVIGTNSQYLDICEYIQRELEKIGISVKVDVMPPSTLRQMKSSGELDVFRASWVADYPDAENYLSLFYSPNFTPNGPNYTHFRNVLLDSLYQSSLLVNQIEDRKLIYTRMDSLIMAEAPVVPLYYDMAIRFVRKEVSGLGINPQNFLFLKTVRKESTPAN